MVLGALTVENQVPGQFDDGGKQFLESEALFGSNNHLK